MGGYLLLIWYWFYRTSTWTCHRCTCVLHSVPPLKSLPVPSLWVIPVIQIQAFCIMHRTWLAIRHIWYYTCFNAILPNHPTLYHRVCFLIYCLGSSELYFQGVSSLYFIAAVTICSDFGAQKDKLSLCFHSFPIYFTWSDGTRCHDLHFLNVGL